MHLKNRWNKRSKPQSIENIATALSFISWKIAIQAVLDLENQGFKTKSHVHRLQIIEEFLIFLLQIADRLSYSRMSDDERSHFIKTLALNVAKAFADNRRDLVGEGKHQKAFIDLLNQRARDYADFGFSGDTAEFDFLRYFGEQIAKTMAGERWVSEYILDLKGPETVLDFRRSMLNLFDKGTSVQDIK